MAIEFIQYSAATATDGALVAADLLDFGTATGVSVQIAKLGYGTDSAITIVATDAGLPVQSEDLANTISTDNSTTSGLAAGGVYTGTAEDVSAYTAITTTIVADRPSQTDGMQFQFSDDGTNFDDVNRFTFSTGTATAGARRFQFPVTAQFYRVVYTNTTTASQDNFRVQTILHRRNVMESIHRIEDNTNPDRSADLTKSVIIAQINGSGDFIPIQSNASGILKIGGAVEVDTWTATGQVLTSPLATATQPVSIGTWTATGQVLTSPLATATQPVSVGTWTATGQVLTSPLATATQPVSVGTWTATGEVQTVQAAATEMNVTTKPFGPIGSQVLSYLDITATTVATLATAAGTNNFLDLVALYVSNHATSPQSVSIRDTSTSTQFNPMIAGDGGGFIWQPAKETRPHDSNDAWSVQTSAATGIKVTAEFQVAT